MIASNANRDERERILSVFCDLAEIWDACADGDWEQFAPKEIFTYCADQLRVRVMLVEKGTLPDT